MGSSLLTVIHPEPASRSAGVSVYVTILQPNGRATARSRSWMQPGDTASPAAANTPGPIKEISSSMLYPVLRAFRGYSGLLR